jgi:hypothetical protein
MAFDGTPSSITGLPPTIAAQMAWAAFDDVLISTDWRLQIDCLDPLKLGVEHDEDFQKALSGADAWLLRAQARAWIATRVLQLAAAIDKTCVRRLSLQFPRSASDADTTRFLANLRRRISDTISTEITCHFDTSISHWEADALRVSRNTEDRELRRRFDAATGLDQLVSVDAARKAINYVYFRTAWHLGSEGIGITLLTDHRFAKLLSHRNSLDETTRARSLVARCVEVLIEDNSRRVASGQDVAPSTRASIHDQIKLRFHNDGVWGLIDLVLHTDRIRYNIAQPDYMNKQVWALLCRRRPRMFTPGKD